jgi:hypothetical protein
MAITSKLCYHFAAAVQKSNPAGCPPSLQRAQEFVNHVEGLLAKLT